MSPDGVREKGQARLTAVLLLIGAVVAGVWIWKRLPADVQDAMAQYTLPVLVGGAGLVLAARAIIGRHLARRAINRRRARLLEQFEQETSYEKRRDLAFAVIELNDYRLEGLERSAPALADVLMTTMKTEAGDKQHRVRGMAASHLGVLGDPRAIPPLLAALEDDHAYVRGCAALGLGRMRAPEAKAKLTHVMTEDWDQTVRSRAREAVERIP
jgi:hypothetical protein